MPSRYSPWLLPLATNVMLADNKYGQLYSAHKCLNYMEICVGKPYLNGQNGPKESFKKVCHYVCVKQHLEIQQDIKEVSGMIEFNKMLILEPV